MEKIYKFTSEEIELKKSQAISFVKKAFEEAKNLGVTFNIPRQGHVLLNPEDFEASHKDEIYVLDYKVQL
jgi:hypothetical protein